MLNIDLKSRLKNKVFWVAIVSAIALLVQQLGLNILPSNYSEIVNSVLTVLTIMGIIVDPSTPGLSDQTITTTANTVDTSNSTEDKTIE